MDINRPLGPTPPVRPWSHVLLIGQLISALLTGTSVFTYMLVNHRPTLNATLQAQCTANCNTGTECQGINIPVIQSVFAYFLLAFHMLLRCQCRHFNATNDPNSTFNQAITNPRTLTRTRTRTRSDRSRYKLWNGNDLEIDDEIAREIDADIGRDSRSNSTKSAMTDSDLLLEQENASSTVLSAHSSSVRLKTRSDLSSLSATSLIPASTARLLPKWCCCNCRVTPVSLWSYLLVSFADVFANYLIVKAYQDTSLTSAMLLDSFALPFCALLSHCFLGVRYTTRHFIGVVLCVIGIALNVVSDTMPTTMHPGSNTTTTELIGSTGGTGRRRGSGDLWATPSPSSASLACGVEYPNALRGDTYVLVAAALYAVSNVAQEKLVKQYDRVEFLGMLGSMGTVICIGVLMVLERDEISIFLHRLDQIAVLELSGFVGCLVVMYCVTSKFLQEGDALLFNLSTLTSDVYGALFSVLLFHSTPHWLYGVAFVFVFFGIIVYGKGGQTT